MTPIVIDASAAGGFILRDERGAMRERVRRANRDHALHAPPIWPAELANLLLSALKRGRIPRPKLARLTALADMLRSSVMIGPDMGIGTAIETAERHGLTVYDASYVRLALHLGAPLLTGDGRMLRAAKASGIELFE